MHSRKIKRYDLFSIKYLISKLLLKIQIPSIKNSKINTSSKVCSRTNLLNVHIAEYSYIGKDGKIINSTIGKFCSIGDRVTIGGAKHPLNWASTSPIFHFGGNILKKNFAEEIFSPYEQTFIGHDVFIGDNVIIKGGVTISNGAVIGMGSVLTKNVGAYEVWAGNPARMIKKRFDEYTISLLLLSEWYNLPDREIKKYASFIKTPQIFAEEIIRHKKLDN